MNLKGLAYKIQKALLQKGRTITINQSQYYSEQLGKMSTKYIIKERISQDGKSKDVTLFETFSLFEVVDTLAKILNGGE